MNINWDSRNIFNIAGTFLIPGTFLRFVGTFFEKVRTILWIAGTIIVKAGTKLIAGALL